MNGKQKQQLKNSIRMCKLRLETIQLHLSDNKPYLNESFNRLLIEKAILRDKLINKKPSFLEKIVRKLKSHGKKELICDYFK